jgi:hypothetical protein
VAVLLAGPASCQYSAVITDSQATYAQGLIGKKEGSAGPGQQRGVSDANRV